MAEKGVSVMTAQVSKNTSMPVATEQGAETDRTSVMKKVHEIPAICIKESMADSILLHESNAEILNDSLNDDSKKYGTQNSSLQTQRQSN